MTVKKIIESYIKKYGITKAELAKKAEMHPQAISDLCAGRKREGRITTRKIMRATNNEIKFKDLRPDLSDILMSQGG